MARVAAVVHKGGATHQPQARFGPRSVDDRGNLGLLGGRFLAQRKAVGYASAIVPVARL